MKKKIIYAALLMLVLGNCALFLFKGEKKDVKAAVMEEVGGSAASLNRIAEDQAKPRRQVGKAAAELAEWLTHRGNEEFLSGRLQKSIWLWELGTTLDGTNELVQTKYHNGLKELKKRIATEYNRGLYSFKFLHYEMAIEHWERVKRLSADPEAPLYQDAEQGILRAIVAIKRRR